MMSILYENGLEDVCFLWHSYCVGRNGLFEDLDSNEHGVLLVWFPETSMISMV